LYSETDRTCQFSLMHKK